MKKRKHYFYGVVVCLFLSATSFSISSEFIESEPSELSSPTHSFEFVELESETLSSDISSNTSDDVSDDEFLSSDIPSTTLDNETWSSDTPPIISDNASDDEREDIDHFSETDVPEYALEPTSPPDFSPIDDFSGLEISNSVYEDLYSTESPSPQTPSTTKPTPTQKILPFHKKTQPLLYGKIDTPKSNSISSLYQRYIRSMYSEIFLEIVMRILPN